jgi:1-acyl-sn-glycerol-3-phosphate acyltransferase
MIALCLTALARFITGASNAQWVGCAPEPTQRIYFANHTSNLDALIIWAALPKPLRDMTRPVAAHDYWTGNRLRHYFADHVFHALLIERKKVTIANNPIPKILAAMEDGCSIIIFPEGKRNPGPEVGEFKSGLYHLARGRPQAELIPVRLENMNRILPKGEILPVPVIGSIQFGTPIRIEANERKPEFLLRAQQAVEKLRPK